MQPFPNLDGLFGLADRKDVDIRPTLLRVLTDLYVQKPAHSREEERHYTELALRLVEAVDAPTRRAVAMRLASYRQAPLAVVERLRRDVAEVAAPMLGDPSLPARPDTDGQAADLRSATDPHDRTDAAADDLSESFFTASASERRTILLNLDYVSTAPPRVTPAAHTIDSIHRLEQAALSRNSAEFIVQLEKTLDLSREQTRRIVEDQSGEPIVVAAKALAMPADALQRILLFLHPAIGHSVRRVYELARLYDEITPQAAEHLVAIWRRSGPRVRRPAVHQRLYWDDPTGYRRLPAPTPRQHVSQANSRRERSERR